MNTLFSFADKDKAQIISSRENFKDLQCPPWVQKTRPMYKWKVQFKFHTFQEGKPSNLQGISIVRTLTQNLNKSSAQVWITIKRPPMTEQWRHMLIIPTLGRQRRWKSMSSRLAWSTKQVLEKPELLHSENLFQKINKQKKRLPTTASKCPFVFSNIF